MSKDPDPNVHETDAQVLVGSASKKGYDLIEVVAKLARSNGDMGVPALKGFLNSPGPGRENLKCVAIESLAIRLGAEGSHIFLKEFVSNGGSIREWAATALLEIADARVWGELLSWYGEWLEKPKSKRKPIPPAMPLSYLIIHAAGVEERTHDLVLFVRERWARLLPFEQQWIEKFAKDASPEGPPIHAVQLPDRSQLPLKPSGLF